MRNVIWYGPSVKKSLDIGIARRLKMAALMVEGTAKRSMVEVKSGRMYRKPHTRVMYRASAPGEAPAKRFGTLQSSITHKEPEKTLLRWHCYVGTDEPYARFLELGAPENQLLPRPFMRPALDKNRKAIAALFTTKLPGE